MMTTLLYLEHQQQLTGIARITQMRTSDSHGEIELDQTLFYPRGGGQPADIGQIETETGTFKVNDVRMQDGIVIHVGKVIRGSMKVGQDATLHVDATVREHHAQLHTAGHLLDVAMLHTGFGFPPNKGYHYPDSPYVEYTGIIPPEDRPRAKTALETEMDRLRSEGFEVQHRIVQAEDVPQLCYAVPSQLPADKPIRIVTVYGDKGIPCGGTHVANINQLKPVRIKKIKVKSGKTRITYVLEAT
ncbi:MAG: hypothetical protein D6675_00970 [Gemmatimonadetes bacterium]|nr:MAG: hypothetical protein D6675_00970 [Gemmatimonadota bacterium]